MAAPTNALPHSLEVPPERIGQYDAEAKIIMHDLKRALESGVPSAATVETIVGRLVGAMPVDIREEVLDLSAFKAELAHAIQNFSARFAEKTPTENDFQNLVALLISIVVRHHAFSLTNNRGLDTHHLSADFNPIVEPSYPIDRLPINSINLQKGLGLFVWIASFYTSWQGLTHYIGEYGIAAFTKVTGIAVAPNAAYWARTLSSITISGYVSQIVQLWKSEIEDRAHKEQVSTPKAAVESAADLGRRPPKGVLLALAALAVVFDVGTNFNGVITAAGQRKEIAAQVGGARATIGQRMADVRTRLKTIDQIPKQVSSTVDGLLAAEAGGTSETGAQGAGPVYHAKAGLYTENGASLASLHGTQFKDQLKAALDNSGLVDGQTLVQEVDTRIDTSSSQVEQLLSEVEALSINLDPMEEPEAVQADLDKVVEKLEEALTILNEDLPDDLEGHMQRYDAFSREMIRIAQTVSGPAYANMQPDKLHQWELPDLKMENKKIEVDEIHYVGFEDIVRVMKENYTPVTGSLLLLIAAILAYFNSYADLHTLPWTRKAYARDAQQAAEKKREYIDAKEEKLCRVLLKALNDGPFSAYFNQREKHHPTSIREIVEARLAELATLRKDTRSTAWRWAPVGPGEGEDYEGHTDVAQRHNARVKAIQRVMGSDEEIQGLLAKLLPGLAVLEGPKPGESMATVIKLNDQTIEKRNAEIQASEIRACEAAFAHILAELQRLGASLQMTEWETMDQAHRANHAQLITIGSRGYPANRKAISDADGRDQEAGRGLAAELPNIVRRELSNLDLRDVTADATLIVMENRLARLTDILSGFTPTDMDNRREIEEARRAIRETIARIETIRTDRERLFSANDRLAEARREVEGALKLVRTLDGWYQNRLTAPADDRTVAQNLGAALGEAHLTLRPGTKLDSPTALRLQTAKQKADEALELLLHENKNPTKHTDMKAALHDAWTVLNRYL